MSANRKKNSNPLLVDIEIKANFTENVLANTTAFALVISDKMLSFQLDCNKMSVVY